LEIIWYLKTRSKLWVIALIHAHHIEVIQDQAIAKVTTIPPNKPVLNATHLLKQAVVGMMPMVPKS